MLSPVLVIGVTLLVTLITVVGIVPYMALAGFIILFGTHHLNSSERHEGMVAAIAIESVVKLLAFLLVGLFVTYGMFHGMGNIFSQALTNADLKLLLALTLLSVVFLPHQFLDSKIRGNITFPPTSCKRARLIILRSE